MDSSVLFSMIKGVGGCAVGYEFISFASSIITASYFKMEKKVNFWVF